MVFEYYKSYIDSQQLLARNLNTNEQFDFDICSKNGRYVDNSGSILYDTNVKDEYVVTINKDHTVLTNNLLDAKLLRIAFRKVEPELNVQITKPLTVSDSFNLEHFAEAMAGRVKSQDYANAILRDPAKLKLFFSSKEVAAEIREESQRLRNSYL